MQEVFNDLRNIKETLTRDLYLSLKKDYRNAISIQKFAKTYDAELEQLAKIAHLMPHMRLYIGLDRNGVQIPYESQIWGQYLNQRGELEKVCRTMSIKEVRENPELSEFIANLKLAYAQRGKNFQIVKAQAHFTATLATTSLNQDYLLIYSSIISRSQDELTILRYSNSMSYITALKELQTELAHNMNWRSTLVTQRSSAIRKRNNAKKKAILTDISEKLSTCNTAIVELQEQIKIVTAEAKNKGVTV